MKSANKVQGIADTFKGARFGAYSQPAHSLAGLMVKVEAVKWCRSGDLTDYDLSAAPTDERLMQAILLDLASIGGPTTLPTTAPAQQDHRSRNQSADPIFALIEAHKLAEAQFLAAVHHECALEEQIPRENRQSVFNIWETTAAATDDPRWPAACIRRNETAHKVEEIAFRMINEPPVSIEGLTALLAYAVEYVESGNAWPDNIEDENEKACRFANQTPWQHYVIANAAEFLDGAPTPAGAAMQRQQIAA